VVTAGISTWVTRFAVASGAGASVHEEDGDALGVADLLVVDLVAVRSAA